MIFNMTKWGSSDSGSGPDLSRVDATASDVLAGKTFINSSGTYVTGTIINRGGITATIDGISDASYTIPQGYHDGTGTVSLTSDIEDFLSAY